VLPDAGGCEQRPRELLTGILLASGRDVGVAEHAVFGNVAADNDALAQRDHGRDLAQRIGGQPVIVGAIDDLNCDRTGVDVGFARPRRYAGVPGTLRFLHALDDATVLVDDVVRGNLGAGGGQPMHRHLAVEHAGVVQHDHVRLAPVVAL